MVANNDVQNMKGNASDEIKAACARMLRMYRGKYNKKTNTSFVDYIGARIQITEIDIQPMAIAPNRKEATVICEITVEEGKHGKRRRCSSLPLVALVGIPAVSQSLNMVYHAPAAVGAPLRIINKTVAVGARTLICRGEIWDMENTRLIASGVHHKMDASKPKPTNKL
ncbi:hypothetical protein Clacol_008295 [Clathrus columnatus]|uniref:Thioesterase domain-containing protein n=1 Tax=Clathrus columnatus TaxID=1419009 RepID=A0AAV5AMX7_9AGAM|nr:hypothetical protein Clacol_008295 [Clathrus columnatus]